jgi:3-dehydroquinate dehydratase / shikimate dehydrogenase
MTTPLLCVTVTAATTAELRAARDAAGGLADLVELRLDGVRDIDVEGALAGRRTPVVVTCRPLREGGAFAGAEQARLAVLERAVRLGAEFVDVEWDSAFGPVLALRGGRGIVLSSHDFTGVPADLEARCAAMRATGAEIVKLAVTARALTDTLPLLAIGRRAVGAHPAPVALVGMGAAGLPSRLLAARFGSCWSYGGAGVAPGQLPPERMVSEYRFRRVTADTRIFGVVGRPLEHSVSPAIHNAAFDAVGLDAVYVPLAARDMADFRAFAEALGLAGASVTAPFKVDLLGDAAEADETARTCGAANTVRVEAGRWSLRNTDVAGFLHPLDRRRIELRGARAAVIGTGGAARAVTVALARRGARVSVHGRRLDAARDVAMLAGGEAKVGLPSRAGWDLLVNATPVGTWPEVAASPVEPGVLAGVGLVYDLVYNPLETALLRAAAAAGCRVVSGLEMLVAQAAEQFEWWTGQCAPRDRMRAAAIGRVSGMTGAV